MAENNPKETNGKPHQMWLPGFEDFSKFEEYITQDAHPVDKIEVSTLQHAIDMTNNGRSFDMEAIKQSRTHSVEEIPVSGPKCDPKVRKSLELLLEIALKKRDKRIRVTDYNYLTHSRKDVRIVSYLDDDFPDQKHNAWVYISDSKDIRKEMMVYKVAEERGVSTANLIGHVPHETLKGMAYDAAVFGGALVEHAGGSYAKLLREYKSDPDIMHRIAINVARAIAQMHIKFTTAANAIDKSGRGVHPVTHPFDVKAVLEDMDYRNRVELKFVAPEYEVKKRIGDALEIHSDQRMMRDFGMACRMLYSHLIGQRKSPVVVSHLDLHTGNILTKDPKRFGKNDFAFIDWESLGLDTWQGDLVDFFLHHHRLANKFTEERYNFTIYELESAYINEFNELAVKEGIQSRITRNEKDMYIQFALKHVYEMFDPTRMDENRLSNPDYKQYVYGLAKYHTRELWNCLDKLATYSECRSHVDEVRNKFRLLFFGTQFKYLHDIIRKT